MGRFSMSRDRFYRPILSADISAINLAVELVLISPRKSGDKIGRFYRWSVIGLSHLRVTVKKPGSAPCPTLVIECGTLLCFVCVCAAITVTAVSSITRAGRRLVFMVPPVLTWYSALSNAAVSPAITDPRVN